MSRVVTSVGIGEPQYVLCQGRAGRLAMYVLASVFGLLGPMLIVLGLAALEWPALLAGALVSAPGVPVAVLLTRRTVRSTQQVRRLRARGVPASATVTAVTPDFDEDMGVLVEVAISGPGLEAFAGTVRSESHAELVVGVRLRALVDTGRLEFTLDSPIVRSGPFYL